MLLLVCFATVVGGELLVACDIHPVLAGNNVGKKNHLPGSADVSCLPFRKALKKNV